MRFFEGAYAPYVLVWVVAFVVYVAVVILSVRKRPVVSDKPVNYPIAGDKTMTDREFLDEVVRRLWSQKSNIVSKTDDRWVINQAKKLFPEMEKYRLVKLLNNDTICTSYFLGVNDFDEAILVGLDDEFFMCLFYQNKYVVEIQPWGQKPIIGDALVPLKELAQKVWITCSI